MFYIFVILDMHIFPLSRKKHVIESYIVSTVLGSDSVI